MSGIYLTSTTTVVHLDIVEKIDFATSRNITNFTFATGNDAQIDMGKNVDQIIVHGVDYSVEHRGVFFPLTFPIEWPADYDAYRDMELINGMMDDQEVVTVSGLANSNLNTEYLINDLEFSMQSGDGAIPLYRFSLTLERKNDILG